MSQSGAPLADRKRRTTVKTCMALGEPAQYTAGQEEICRMEATVNSRVVLVHDWLTGMRGGEKCLEVLCRRWPEAPLYTLLHKRGALSPAIEQRPIHASALRFFPKVDRYYRWLLPLMPLAARWRLPPCDLVVSLSHCVAKGALPPAGVPHLCYCFTPMRYAWHMREAYFARDGRRGLRARLRDAMLARLRDWDYRTAERVTDFVAISQTVRRRIADCYGRDSRVIYPPVDTDFYTPSPLPRQDFYLVVSAFAPYKRIDLAVEACRRLGRRLVVIGTGQDEARLRKLAAGTVQFLGWQPDEVIRDQMRRCRALLFPGEEDFGIVPVEAQACGTPVIAYGRGGATETVVAHPAAQPTGLFFEDQASACLIAALEQFEKIAEQFSPQAARRQAQHFNGQRFAQQFFGLVDELAREKAAGRLTGCAKPQAA
jgi:glycosyltransferase involved in cell wall biosynthesis